MNLKQSLYILGFTLSTATFNANAALTSYTVNGANLVYSSLGNLTWTADGNLFQTLANSYAGGASAFVDAVIASVPGGKINDTPNYYDTPANSGYHILSNSDFNTSTGQVSWFGAKAYVSYLNNISYGGSNQWSLPGWTDTGAEGPQFGYNGTDFGYNVNPSSSPLAQLYYGELNKTTAWDTNVDFQSGYGIFGNNGAQIAGGAVGPFSNVQSNGYWLGTEYAPNPNNAWLFVTEDGGQGNYYKGEWYYAWAITPGQVPAVPVPGAVWLMGTGLIGMLGLKKRRS